MNMIVRCALTFEDPLLTGISTNSSIDKHTETGKLGTDSHSCLIEGVALVHEAFWTNRYGDKRESSWLVHVHLPKCMTKHYLRINATLNISTT